jgi:hypothetical protein
MVTAGFFDKSCLSNRTDAQSEARYFDKDFLFYGGSGLSAACGRVLTAAPNQCHIALPQQHEAIQLKRAVAALANKTAPA